MRLHRASIVAIAVVTAVTLSACGRSSEEEPAASDIARVEPIEGSDVAKITLSQEAAERLDIRTASVAALRGDAAGGARSSIPYAAVLYDPDGKTWTYTNPEPLVFVRAPISVDRIANGTAVLTSGPSPGTEVVMTGAAELLGTEYEVGEE